MLPKIIVGVVLLLLAFFVVGSNFRDKRPDFTKGPNQKGHEQQQQNSQNGSPDLGTGVNEPFYSKDGLYLTHSWPSEGNFSNEETEILLFNESDSTVEVKSFDLTYTVEGKTYPQKSGTWEKFPSKESWEKIEYFNIDERHYQNQPLVLAPGEKGKLHWHIQFGSQPLDGKQTVHVKLTLLKGSGTITIDEQFKRDSGTVVSKDEH